MFSAARTVFRWFTTLKLSRKPSEINENHEKYWEFLGQIIAEDLHSLVDLPPVKTAIMDGYAIKCEFLIIL